MKKLTDVQTKVMGNIFEYVGSLEQNVVGITNEKANIEEMPEEMKDLFNTNLNTLKFDYFHKAEQIDMNGVVTEGSNTESAVTGIRAKFFDSLREAFGEELVNETLVFISEGTTLLDDCSKLEAQMINLLGEETPYVPEKYKISDSEKTYGPFTVDQLNEFANHAQATDDMKKEYADLIKEMEEKGAGAVTFKHVTKDGQLSIEKLFHPLSEETQEAPVQ